MKKARNLYRKAWRFTFGVALAIHLDQSPDLRRRREAAIRASNFACLALAFAGFALVAFRWPDHTTAGYLACLGVALLARCNFAFLRAARILGRWQERHHSLPTMVRI